jgi:hypothetical protein
MFSRLLLSALQICFLPGFIAFVIIHKRYRPVNSLLLPVFSFGLSLIINYIIVSFLAYFELYTRLSVICLLISECFILAILVLTHRFTSELFNFGEAFKELRNGVNFLVDDHKPAFRSVRLVIFLLSVLLLISLLAIMILNIGKIFNTWDAVFSWNRWAIDFSNNHFPPGTYHYPQLLPANWSICYVLCGWPFQFVPKAMMPLFLILSVYALIVLGLLKRKPFLFTTVIFIFLGMSRLNWTDGFADVPVAFFGLMVFIFISLINKIENSENQKYLLLGAFVACGAAVTKQAGIFVLLTYPLMVFLFAYKNSDLTYKKIFSLSLYFLFMIVIIVLPYYLYADRAIRTGQAESEIGWVTHEIYNGATYPERFIKACILFSGVFSSRILFVLCIIPFLLSLKNKNLRRLSFAFTIPYSLIWALFFSYDTRNSAIIIPYFSLGIGYGIEIILNSFQKSPDTI